MSPGDIFYKIFPVPILNVLLLLHFIIGDFALSIIVLTVLIRLLLFPLTLRQLKSTKAMQQVQPLIADVKKQYPKDQRAQLEATQAIYKEYGINPLGGCLPLFVQLPVLYGLYFALNAVVMKGATIASINSLIYPFLPKLSASTSIANLTNFGWFTFINPALHISLGASDPTHILPVLAGLATFVQLRMSQPQNVSATNNAMATQMKLMQYIMPFFTFFIALNFPAGLALYWTTSSIFSMIQQYFVTGWGALLVKPNLNFLPSLGGTGNSSKPSSNNSGGSKGKSYSGDARKETRLLTESSEGEGSNGRKTTYNGNGNSANGTRRRPPRPGSASARRRGNIPKRNPTRS